MREATSKHYPSLSSPAVRNEPRAEGDKWFAVAGRSLPLDPDLLLDAISGHTSLLITDRSGNILYVNRRACELGGWRAAELLGRSFRRLLPENGGETEHFWASIVAGRPWRGELRQRTSLGRELWTDTAVTPLPQRDGEDGLRLIIQTGITGLKRTEAALRFSEQRHRALLEQANDAILLVDMDGWLVEANRRAEELTGYGRAELCNMHMQQLVPGNLRGALLDLHQEVLEEGCKLLHGGVLLCRDGSLIQVDISCSVIDGGGPRLIQGILHDVTRRRRLEGELVRARVEAERAGQARMGFLSRVSHELRTPLNAILGFAQLLQEGGESRRESIGQILEAGWQLLELIEDLLNYSRIETGALRIERGAVPAREILQECRDLMEPLARERNVSLELMPVPGHIMIRADRERLKEVLLSLGTNAIKYNRINGSVSLSAVVESNRVRINVSDTGIGIRPEKMQLLFEPFERLGQEDGSIRGSGLGLVIAKRLTELMGGTLGVWSEPGVGTSFWLDLELIPEG